MMAIVFFMGMFLDWLGIVMIVFPIFLPIMDMFGFDACGSSQLRLLCCRPAS